VGLNDIAEIDEPADKVLSTLFILGGQQVGQAHIVMHQLFGHSLQ
jgi:hypothetical protein